MTSTASTTKARRRPKLSRRRPRGRPSRFRPIVAAGDKARPEAPRPMPESSTRLYLILPPIADPAQFKPLLLAALEAGDIACLLLRGSAPGEVKSTAQALMPLVHERDAAFLVESDPRLAARVGADGVHLAYSPDHVGAALSSLGPDAIVGV